MSAAGRWAAVARAAGGRDPAFLIGGATPGWGPATLDDFERAGVTGAPPQIATMAVDPFLASQPLAPLLLTNGKVNPV